MLPGIPAPGQFFSAEWTTTGHSAEATWYGYGAQSVTVPCSTPLVAGHTYSWSASHGNAYPCLPGMNCLTLTWDFPCGIVNPGYVKVTETDTATGCSTTTTLWITVNP